MAVQAPVADSRPHTVDSPHGSRTDNYYWLRDDQREDADMLAYLAAENAYKTAKLAHIKQYQDDLFDEINGRIEKDDATVPYRYRGYYYYSRYETDDEYPIYARRKGSLNNPEEILLDVNQQAAGHDYYEVGDYEVSPNGEMLAYAEDMLSRRLYTIRFKDLKTGEILADAVTGAAPSIVWANDNQTVFYLQKDPVTLLPKYVKRHRLGTDPANDVVVYEEQDDSFYPDLSRSGDDRFLLIELDSTVTNEIRYLDADDAGGEFQVLLPRDAGHEFDADHIDDLWIIKSNWQAKNFRILQATENAVDERANWQEIVPHDDAVFIHDFDVFNDYLVIEETSNALRRVRVLDRDGTQRFIVRADQAAYVAQLDMNPEQDSVWLRYAYSSLNTPDSIYDVNMRTQARKLLKQDKVLGGFDARNYSTERLWADARDGKKIPVSVVYRKGFKKDGTAPMYQYAYGSYGYSTDPEFDEDVLSLLDRGFIYAIAHVRGGQELGRDWYDDGKLLNKKNTFWDFIDVTEHLVDAGYADRNKVVANGRSAGGLLAGAIANMRPDLYRLIVADVPFVDAVTTMLDESIPLTTLEFDEWGNPKNKAYYDYILDYSPYDNVQAQDYPALLITTGLWDSQVQYYEAAKWVAKLRALKTDKNPLLFHINMDAGHSGRSGRFRENRELAMQYAFVLDQMGLIEEQQ
ncbi:MAG: S9 family peptidase [Gammaproteobacteria bacterium]|nr:S9 family peptidase [Gammaproteobacteria bacterium]